MHYDRRVLIRLIGVRFSDMVSGNYQIDLFEDTNSMIGLYQAMDRMQHKYGAGVVRRAAGMGGKRDPWSGPSHPMAAK